MTLPRIDWQKLSWGERSHLAMAFVWTLLIPPTLIWWKESILWVLLISLYANIATHLGGFQAAKAERNSPDAE